MPTLLKRSNGIYYVVSTDPEGHRKWVSTGQRLKSSAMKALTEGNPRPQKPPRGKPVEEFFKDFLVYGENVYSPENLQVYRRAFHGFIRLIGNIRLNDLSQRHVDTFKTKRMGEVSRVTVNIELRTLRAAFYCAMRWDYHAFGKSIEEGKRWWANKKLLVTNPANNTSVVVRAVDFGPPESTGLSIAVSPGAAEALGVEVGDEVEIAFADPHLPLGTVE